MIIIVKSLKQNKFNFFKDKNWFFENFLFCEGTHEAKSSDLNLLRGRIKEMNEIKSWTAIKKFWMSLEKVKAAALGRKIKIKLQKSLFFQFEALSKCLSRL